MGTISSSGNCRIRTPLTWYGVLRTGLSVKIRTVTVRTSGYLELI